MRLGTGGVGTARRRRRRAASGSAVALVIGLALSGCTSSGGSASPPAPTSSTTASPKVAEPVVAVASTVPSTVPNTGGSTTGSAGGSTGGGSAGTATEGSTVPYASPVTVTVTDGTFTSVQVSTSPGGLPLEGDVSADQKSWVSQEPPRPATSYQVSATVTDSAGQVHPTSTTFTVAAVPDDRRVSFSVSPDDGTTVGIGQPIVVRFMTPITRRAAFEKVMLVDARTSAGVPVLGSWHWLSDGEVHWRPKAFWTPGTKVTLTMRIAGVQASSTRFGRKDYAETFTIGASHVTRVDGTARTTRVYRDGVLVDTWPSGTGRQGLETYSGTYVVLGKDPVVQMDSCSARITCDKKDPDYYDEKEFWATRITASGTFLHAASWDGLLGRANVSHGCIHLSDADAKEFFSHAVVGDVVIVTHTGRGPAERIATQDPGLYDWNLSWSAWQAGSALH